MYEISNTRAGLSRHLGHFGRNFVHPGRFRRLVQRLCTIFRTFSLVSTDYAEFLYEKSYSWTDFARVPSHVGRFFVHFRWFRPIMRSFVRKIIQLNRFHSSSQPCWSIFRTFSLVSTDYAEFLYEKSYSWTDFARVPSHVGRFFVHFRWFRPIMRSFVRKIIQLNRFRSSSQPCWSIFRTFSLVSTDYAEFLYEKSYNWTDFGRVPSHVGRFFEHSGRSLPPSRPSWTNFRTSPTAPTIQSAVHQRL